MLAAVGTLAPPFGIVAEVLAGGTPVQQWQESGALQATFEPGWASESEYSLFSIRKSNRLKAAGGGENAHTPPPVTRTHPCAS